jgi:hypothetical protein
MFEFSIGGYSISINKALAYYNYIMNVIVGMKGAFNVTADLSIVLLSSG